MGIWTILAVICTATADLDFRYHKYEAATKLMQGLVADYPTLCSLYSIGKSVDNRELWVLRVTSDIENVPIMRPRVKWVANMHGDEAVGRELTFQFAQYLTQNYETNSTVSDFLSRIDLHLMPSLNPDGFEKSVEGKCQGWRNNANRVDLNRNFPDQFRDKKWLTERKTIEPLEVETQAMVDWIEHSNFVLSLNLHAGSVVASYPFDDSRTMRGNVYSKSPDDDFFQHLARTYADNHGTMSTMDQKSCGYAEKSFHKGITNGAEWYQVPGGMEDYNYLHGDCFEITIELTCCKYPKADELEKEWNLNKNSLWAYTMQAYQSARGVITDSAGNALPGAVITVAGIDKDVHTDPQGVYWRPLVNGKYTISASADGYVSKSVEITVENGGLELNFTLLGENEIKPESPAPKTPVPSPEVPDSSEKSPESPKTPVETTENETIFKYFSHDELTAFLQNLADQHSNICRLESAGKSSQGRDMWVMEISDNPGVHEELEPEFKYVANMHGNEIKGRMIAIAMIHHLLTNYETDPSVAEMVNSKRLFFMPSMNPDGHEKALEMIKSHGAHYEQTKKMTYGRENAQNIDLNRDFPDHFYPNRASGDLKAIETQNIVQWSENHRFVLSLNVHGGGLVANYPLDDSADFGENTRRREKRTTYPPSESVDNDVFVHLAKVYASHHPTMGEGKSCRSDQIGIAEDPKAATLFGIENFTEGIVNGQVWYPVAGGMQDWNYWNTGAYEITVEIGCIKFPAEEYLEQYWLANKVN